MYIKIIILLLWSYAKAFNNQKIMPNNFEYKNKNNNNFYKTKNNKYYLLRKTSDELNILKKKEYYKKFGSNNSINEFRNLNEIKNKCLSNDEIGLKNSLCIECNIEEGYFPVYNNYIENKNKNLSKYVECSKETEKPKNYYFNPKLKVFERCYETCETCYGYGDMNYNNCSSCKEGYLFQPEIKETKNCVRKCEYYYYYSLTGIYHCTENYYCSKEASLLIENLNKCIYDCKYVKDYIFKYNGECLKICPENTHPNELNICLENDEHKCYFTKKELKIDGKLLDYNIINIIIKNYVEEFIYTNNHVSQFVIKDYSILLYKNKSCLSKFPSNYSIFDFDECIKKINKIYNISSPLVLIFDRINKYGSPISLIYFFDPNTGIKLDTSFCNSLTYNVLKNISEIDKVYYDQQLIEQNIDIYDLENEFYNSLCNYYNKNFKKDIILFNRIAQYFPNVSICEPNCEYKGNNLLNHISKCYCKYVYNDYYKINKFFENGEDLIQNVKILAIFAKIAGNEAIENSKVASIKCLKYALYPKNFIVNIGGIFLLILFLIQIFCVIILTKKNFIKKITKFIDLVINVYIKNKKEKISNKNNKYKFQRKVNNFKYKEKKFNETSSSLIFDEIHKYNTSPRKEKNKINNENNLMDEQKESRISLDEIITNMSEEKTDKGLKTSNNSKNYDIKELKKYKDLKLKKKSILDMKKSISIKNMNKEDFFTESEIKEYLTKSPDELNFYKAFRRDKRSFCVFLINKIIKKNIIVQTFVKMEETKPLYLKIFLFIFYIQIYFLSNTFLFLTNDIDSLNYKQNFIFYVKLTILKAIKSIVINKIIRFCIELFLLNKYTIKEMIRLEKDNEKNLREAAKKLIKKTKIKYIIFIILSFLISTLSWCLVCGFNFSYPNTKFYFFLICILIVIFEQIISVGFALLETCFRFLAFKCKTKAFFSLSQYINGIN